MTTTIVNDAAVRNFEAEPTETEYSVTLVGYGRYGNYIGPKYAKRGYLWTIDSVVDPAVTRESFGLSVLGQQRPQTQLYANFDTWRANYFETLSPQRRDKVVVELALAADRVLDVAWQFILAGVKQLILPKPVVKAEADLPALLALTRGHRVKAAVASQWFYSSIPKLIARDLKCLTSSPNGKRFEIERAIIEFSKENGHTIAPAPLCELPHALQILQAVGLLTGARRERIVSEPYSVVVHYDVPMVRNGVVAVAKMDYARKSSQVSVHPEWDYQERTLSVYGAEPKPILWVDFWMKFSPCGDSVVYPGRYCTRESDGQVHSHGIAEDLLQQMHEAIFQSFAGTYEHFELDDTVLALSRYEPIGLEIARVHAAWSRANVELPTAAT